MKKESQVFKSINLIQTMKEAIYHDNYF
jgi:hypothetical protein